VADARNEDGAKGAHEQEVDINAFSIGAIRRDHRHAETREHARNEDELDSDRVFHRPQDLPLLSLPGPEHDPGFDRVIDECDFTQLSGCLEPRDQSTDELHENGWTEYEQERGAGHREHEDSHHVLAQCAPTIDEHQHQHAGIDL
jgi:hypothetical protein